MRQRVSTVDEKDRLVTDADGARISQRRQQRPDMRQIIFPAVCLGLEDLLRTVKVPRPRLVCPAEGKRKVRFTGAQDLLKWLLQQLLAFEPVVVIAEAMDPVLPGQRGLGLTHVRQAQIVIAKLGRHPRLLVTRKEWLGLPDVDPLA